MKKIWKFNLEKIPGRHDKLSLKICQVEKGAELFRVVPEDRIINSGVKLRGSRFLTGHQKILKLGCILKIDVLFISPCHILARKYNIQAEKKTLTALFCFTDLQRPYTRELQTIKLLFDCCCNYELSLNKSLNKYYLSNKGFQKSHKLLHVCRSVLKELP